MCVFFCKPKTAYDMHISDWSSDVCSSDLPSKWSWSASWPCWGRRHVGPGGRSVKGAAWNMARRPAQATARHWQRRQGAYICPMITARSYAGQFLLALPGMEDMRFDHSVIAMCVHDENGSLGIAVSDEIDGVSLHDLDRKSTRLNSSH